MKKTIRLALFGILFATFACNKDDDNPIVPTDEEEFVELSGDLSTQTLDASKRYIIKGQTFVQNGQILTIPAGTVIHGERRSKGTLIINEGGKIEAKGTAQNPIVF